jgi:hypothetical protein
VGQQMVALTEVASEQDVGSDQGVSLVTLATTRPPLRTTSM